MEAVPKIGKFCERKLNKKFMNGPRCVNWRGAAKISYGEIIQLENIFTPEDVIYPYISWGGNCVVIESAKFHRAGEVEDDRIKVLMRMIAAKHAFSDHIWEFKETPEFSFGVNDGVSENDEGSKTDEDAPKNDEEDGSDEEFQTPRGTVSTSSGGRKRKKRLPDCGMEKRKQNLLCTSAKQAPFNEGMKSFVD
ncbi:unnamed protein product [Eruca vesicaria subsp. sativa]|uniref:Uncharacterized protein n=1 Tax=Eruca vesicaria subsp. sativa TaxID=29727 RepID=A0ABC8J5P8_ERUVS|nr:unnamed protein product [Eruca vesicaria subsp. sativa]